ncbi:DUF502 domain-containing protein [Candidatus Nitronereus thalassa]|uniref:DUF502 domain-containing protein n=1 Tax=Candidatus Nitronereus thalassa TaxID=3020898 RepID=A0ABU3K7U0_9BACT|nr:DUF502 domain-containing protein [Candidatus Nitronereus thalassa]MDT7042455.1 DUF502 domain-containing protein [Candidatus Nitronereus thalassa]
MKTTFAGKIKRYFITGLFVVVPAWGTFLILSTLFMTLDGLWVDLVGPHYNVEVPGAGIMLLVLLILVSGMAATHFLGQRLVKKLEEWLDRVPLVRSIYQTLKGMTDVFQFRERFGHSTVVVFPFPRDGVWAIGFVMDVAPPVLQRPEHDVLLMIFVPTAIHPFTGYLAFVPRNKAQAIQLKPQEAMKMEFSAGIYKPPRGWLTASPSSDMTK